MQYKKSPKTKVGRLVYQVWKWFLSLWIRNQYEEKYELHKTEKPKPSPKRIFETRGRTWRNRPVQCSCGSLVDGRFCKKHRGYVYAGKLDRISTIIKTSHNEKFLTVTNGA